MLTMVSLPHQCLKGIQRKMDSKDFIKLIKGKLKETQKKSLSVYSYKQRQSRPRVKKDILRKNED